MGYLCIFFAGENNPGNFQEVINVIRRFSPEVDEMMRNAPKNCTYRSKTIQNQVIDVLKDFILEKIVNGVKVRRLFSVLADEASDVSNKEQMSLVIRFLNQDKAIQEKFVGFLHCENGTSGAELAKLIEKALHEIGLSLSDVRGQGYDGAGSMAGKVRGTAARISARYPKARYVHCWSHQLNLCVVKVTKVVKVKDMFDVCRVIADFFSYQKRCDFLEKLMEKEGIPLNERQSHIDLCRTRWVERIDGLVRMMKLFWVTHKALQLIGTPGSVDFNGDAFNPNTRAIAAGLAKQMEDFTFAMSLVVAKEILSYTASLTKALQDPKVSAVDSYESVSNVIDTISAVHLNVVAYNKKWIRKAEELHESVAPSNSKHDILTPRAPSVSLYRSNVPSSTREEFFRRNLTIPCLENVLSELRSRFSQENIELARGFYVIPSIMASNPTLWKKKVLAFMEANVDDMHDDPGLYEAELELWGNRWSKSDISPSTLEQTLALTSDVIYPNVFKVLHLLAVLPVTTCSCERSISTLRRIKTYLRNTMGQERFNGLALLNIHRNIEIDSEEIINRLAIKYPKRLKLKNIFDED